MDQNVWFGMMNEASFIHFKNFYSVIQYYKIGIVSEGSSDTLDKLPQSDIRPVSPELGYAMLRT